MRIKLDDKHWLNSDPQCYWITKKVKVKKGKTAGTIAEKNVSGYTATFAQAVDSFIEKRIRAAEIASFTELVEEVNNLKKEVRDWKCAVEREK